MNRRHVTRPVGKLRQIAALTFACLVGACGATPEQSAVDHGRELFESKALSRSNLNDYTCATCHDTEASTPPSKKSGGALSGVTLRSRFWGGQTADLLSSINACRNYFMGDNQPLVATDPHARSLYAYLESLEPGDANPIPFTIVTGIEPLARGDEGNGRLLYSQACLHCHGNPHDGLDRLSARVPILPEDTLVEHAEYSARVQRLVFTEKIRHGLFLGYGGVMPPFSAEVLSDADVSDLLEALGVLGE
jgi:thiosulfate dehydrogenase